MSDYLEAQEQVIQDLSDDQKNYLEKQKKTNKNKNSLTKQQNLAQHAHDLPYDIDRNA